MNYWDCLLSLTYFKRTVQGVAMVTVAVITNLNALPIIVQMGCYSHVDYLSA